MTENEQPQPAQAAVPPVNVSTAAVPGPDGQAWVAINIQYGMAAITLVVLPDTAAQLGEIFAKALPEAAAAVRRARSGLILPGNGMSNPAAGPLPHLPGMPG